MLYRILWFSIKHQQESAIGDSCPLHPKPPSHFLPHPTLLDCHGTPVWVPWVIQKIPIGYLFYIWYCKFPCYSLHMSHPLPPPLSTMSIGLFSMSVKQINFQSIFPIHEINYMKRRRDFLLHQYGDVIHCIHQYIGLLLNETNVYKKRKKQGKTMNSRNMLVLDWRLSIIGYETCKSLVIFPFIQRSKCSLYTREENTGYIWIQ